MTMSGYQPADVSASQESEYIIVTKDKKIYENSRKQIQYNDRYSRTKYRFSKRWECISIKNDSKRSWYRKQRSEVVSVEKNTMVNASETESTTAAKEDQGTDSQWNLKSIHVDKAKDTATDER